MNEKIDHVYLDCATAHGNPETGEPGCPQPNWCHENPYCMFPKEDHPTTAPFPESAVANVSADFVNPPIAQPHEPLAVAGGLLVQETAVHCMHCGVSLGEFRNGQRILIQHPNTQEGFPPFGMWLMEEDTIAGPQHIGQKIGSWVSELHARDADPTPLRGETRRFRNVVGDAHLMHLLNEVAGQNIREIASLTHLIKFPGVDEQIVLDLTGDECNFRAQLVIRTVEACTHEHRTNNDHQGTDRRPGAPESEDADNRRNSPEDIRVDVLEVFRNRNRNADGASGDETYSHDPTDPAHDD